MKLTIDFSKNSHFYSHSPGTSSRSMFFYPLMAGYEECGNRYFLERDDFNDYLILYTVSGKAHLTYRKKEYTVEAGDCFFLYCGEFHSYHTVGDEPWVIKWVHFNGSLAKYYFDKVHTVLGPVIRLGKSTKIPATISKIVKHLKSMQSESEIIMSLLITEILTELLLISHMDHSKDIPGIISAAVEFIENNYTSKITLEQIASVVSVNKFYLSHQFKKHLGYSVYEYILIRRLDEGKKLLLDTNESMAQISDKLGYDTPSHFSRFFKKYTGYSPLKYRKARNQQTDSVEVKYSKEIKNTTVEF